MSPSSRRAWIEISLATSYKPLLRVALLAEGVDRNFSRCRNAVNIVVVALLAEGVDRNQNIGLIFVKKNTSPSSRRAWIEILLNV